MNGDLMALIVETGAVVPNANTYVTRQELIDYAVLRGVVIADDDASDILLISATDYLESFRARYKGAEVQPGVQPLAWPREGVTAGFVIVGSDTIPDAIKKAQIVLAMEASKGTVLLPTQKPQTGGVTLIRQKLGPIEKQYAVTGDTDTPLDVPLATSTIAPYLRSGGVTKAVRV